MPAISTAARGNASSKLGVACLPQTVTINWILSNCVEQFCTLRLVPCRPLQGLSRRVKVLMQRTSKASPITCVCYSHMVALYGVQPPTTNFPIQTRWLLPQYFPERFFWCMLHPSHRLAIKAR
eukprot:6191941-Pleurochrysis_carterae.AAC.4